MRQLKTKTPTIKEYSILIVSNTWYNLQGHMILLAQLQAFAGKQ